jgi:hypothetical protein
VIETARINVDATEGGPLVERTLLTFGPFELRGTCLDQAGTIVQIGANFRATEASFASGVQGVAEIPANQGRTLNPVPQNVADGGLTSRSVWAVSNSSRVLQAGIIALNPTGASPDCVFQVSGLGR